MWDACPTGARVFGNLLDPNSEIRKIIETKKVFRLKEELSTEPKFWYLHGLMNEKMLFLSFVQDLVNYSLRGNRTYHIWMGSLTFLMILGAFLYTKQLENGLIVTGMNDYVSWGLYISNFTFLVGLAAAAVMLVIPAYIFF